jgi:biopolymer transport protein ExbD
MRMAMHIPSKGPSAQINMTPLIDVLLVLLIIFMVITPLKPVGLEARVLQDSKEPASPADQRALVVTVRDDGGVAINSENFGAGEWPERLRAALARRADRTVFFTASGGMEFQWVARAIDEARTAGAGNVGLMPAVR